MWPISAAKETQKRTVPLATTLVRPAGLPETGYPVKIRTDRLAVGRSVCYWAP
jgi:hypothetical protein